MHYVAEQMWVSIIGNRGDVCRDGNVVTVLGGVTQLVECWTGEAWDNIGPCVCVCTTYLIK